MSDIFTKAKRSEVMSRIRSRGNKDTEGAMVTVLRAAGIKGWRKHFEIRIKKEEGRKRAQTETSNIERRTSNIEKNTKGASESVSGRGRNGGGKSVRGGETSNVQRSTSNIERKRNKVESTRTSVLALRPFKVRPDFVFRREKVALFVDGCFWHGCPWHGTKPASNKSFWQQKLQKNRTRDWLVTRTLRKAGWRVVRVWEHVLPRAAKNPEELEKLVNKIKGEMAAKRRKKHKSGS